MKKINSLIGAIALCGAISSQVISCGSQNGILLANKINTSKKVIMLTFDDGPFELTKGDPKAKDGIPKDWDYNPSVDKPGYTIDDEILDILSDCGSDKQHPIPATFFEVGEHVDRRKKNKDLTNTMNRIIDNGSWIGSHTYSHKSYKNNPDEGITDIKKSYETIDEFYKEHFTSKNIKDKGLKADKVEVSTDSISKLNLLRGDNSETIDIPLRLGYLQTYNGMNDIKDELNISQMIYGYLGTDWNQTANATKQKIEKYFKDNNLGDYDKLKQQYGDNIDGKDPAAKTFDENETKAKQEISKEIILGQYKSHLSNGMIFVCHTRTFAKYWLKDLIKYCQKQGYSFAGMNPYYKETYYKNWGSFKE